MDKNIVCISIAHNNEPQKGSFFTPVYVNRLFRMCKKHLTVDYNFICISNMDPLAFDEGVNVIPVPEEFSEEYTNIYQNVPATIKYPIWWMKYFCFKKDFIKGTNLYFDLDVIFHDNIDCFFEYEPDDICMFNCYGVHLAGRERPSSPAKYNGGIFRCNSERHSYIWDIYQKNRDYIHTFYDYDDDALTRMLKLGDREHSSFPDEWGFYYYERTPFLAEELAKIPMPSTREKIISLCHGPDDKGTLQFETIPPEGSKLCHIMDMNVILNGREPNLLTLKPNLSLHPSNIHFRRYNSDSIRFQDKYFLDHWDI